jgi:hypothetical protein
MAGFAQYVKSVLMKPQYPTKPIALVISVLTGHLLLAQPALEFATGAGPTTNGSTISAQTVTFENNTSNPTGFSFSAFTPTTTVTYSLSNQQYALKTQQNSNHAGLSFGGNNNNSGVNIIGGAIYTPMNYVSAAPNSDFSPTPANIGTGMSTSQNYAVEVFTSAMGMYNAGSATNATYYIADITLTFNTPVTDPVLHVVGMGGYYGSGSSQLGFTSNLTLATTGVTLSELSGSPELSVTSTTIDNNAANPTSTTGSGAASGSILVTGTNITQLVFHVYMRGNGGNSSWSSGSEHTGDAWLLGVSMETSLFVLPLKISEFSATAQGNSAFLQWTASTQENTDHYNVQYSQDGTNWQSLSDVSVTGNPDLASNYSYVQYSPATGNAYYRIAQVSSDGSYSYTNIQHLTFGAGPGAVTCYPNPSRGQVTIASGAASFKGVQLLSIDGKVLQVATGFRSGESIDLSTYPAGVYLVVVYNTDGTTQTTKVQKI